ncbi:MAG: TlpA family protein disulfide reductase [Deltaproteobacteria bacterium]|nr:TlpA family protein disulfide reductase [Deltaproteobacteria bacterium]MBW1874229.1 TlpA family protein disulfide reductase [Deltaproteobacteria bacterium]MBW2210814.1 TlpA family protein disulfide reductase [Deltaproteobacteria bacterium]MBW2213657.1 TlpA family protein disulfide reductase [Deltaproteobacteria bacterium]MBW2378418.1 TlpA family protein disulfide reductase [Deltaproteobacteria bacterium]
MPRREVIATILVAALAFPLMFIFTGAVADARARAREAPFRAILGNARFEQMMDGQGGVPHYLGASLRAPDFTLPKQGGGEWKMSEQRGKVIVMNFWTVTCRPCIQEMPTIELLAEITEDWGDVEIVAVSTDRTWEEAETIIPRSSRITSLLDAERKVVTGQFGTNLFPETWIVDANGVVRFRYDGALDWSDPIALDLIRAYR